MLYVVLGIIEPKDTHSFLVVVSTFSAKSCRLPKHMVLAYYVAPPSFIDSTENVKNTVEVLSKGTESTIDAPHEKSIKNRKKQMQENETVQPSQSQQASSDWSKKVNL